MIENIFVGILMIIFGVAIIIYKSKKQTNYPLFSITFSGFAGGVAFILLGIITIMNKLNFW